MKLPLFGGSKRRTGGGGGRWSGTGCPKADVALSRALAVVPSVIGKVRHGTGPIGAPLLLWMHEGSEFSIRELRTLMIAPVAGEATTAV